MTNDQPIDEPTALTACQNSLENFKNCLVTRVDPANLTPKSKIPFKLFSLKELLLHRMTALADSALTLYESNRRVPSFLVIRGCMETTGSIVHIRKKCESYLENKDLDSFDESLMKGLAGGRDKKAKIAAVNVLSLIDKIDREYPGYRKMYDVLCEYTHPNFFGVLDVFGKIDPKQVWLDLGDEIRKPPAAYGLAPLLMSMTIFEESYNIVDDLGQQINDWLDQKTA